MPEFAVVAVAAVAAVIGVFVGFMARRFVAANAVKHAERYAQRLEAEARAKQKEIVLEGKDEALHLRRAAEEEAREQRRRATDAHEEILGEPGSPGATIDCRRWGLRPHSGRTPSGRP